MNYHFPLRKDSVILLSIMEREIMTNEEIDHYKDALSEAKKSEAAALKAALPKKWFGIAIALIVGGLVATNGSEYFQYSGISSLLILVEVGIVIKFVMEFLGNVNSAKNTGKEGIITSLASEMFSLILILFVANLALTGILQVILQFFSNVC